jgi:threonine dehydratase
MIPSDWFQQALDRIRPHVKITPLTYESNLDCFFKWENQQTTGSFKLRGAVNKVFSLQDWELEKGLVAASAGNHGLGLAYASQLRKASVTVFASEHAVPSKITAMREMGAQVVLIPGGYAQAEAQAIHFSQENAKTWVSPYNDSQIIAGQATVAMETLIQNPQVGEASWIIPVGGGGLISGIGAFLKSQPASGKAPEVIGVQPEASPYFHSLFYNGSQEQVIESPTLADGLAGAIENGSLTIPIMQRTVDKVILVSEEAISSAISYAWNHYEQKIEGSAAVTLAAVLEGKIATRPLVLIMTGGNIQSETFSVIISNNSTERKN